MIAKALMKVYVHMLVRDLSVEEKLCLQGKLQT